MIYTANDLRTINTTVEVETYKEMAEIAKTEDRPMASVIRMLLSEALQSRKEK